MMKINVATAVKSDNYSKKFNHTTDSSAGAYQLLPVFYHEILPKGKLKCDKSLFYSQVLPMSVPTMGRYRFKFNHFFVPYKYVWPAWEDFYAQNLHYYSNNVGNSAETPAIPAEKPYITQADLFKIFIGSADLTTVGSSIASPDFVYTDENNVVMGGQFTRKGIVALKVLEHLGYRLSFRLDDNTKLEILTLLCYAKVYLDHYYPSNYAFVGADFYNIQQAFIMDAKDVRASGSHNVVYYNAIYAILHDLTYTYFNNSIYYDAWDTPTSPNHSSSVGAIKLNDPTNNSNANQVVTNQNSAAASPSNSTFKPNNGTPFVGSNSSTSQYVANGVLTNWVVNALERLQNFVTRYQLSGSRLIDRWLAYLGQKLPDSHRSVRLDGSEVEVEVGEVLSTADSYNSDTGSSSVLGDKAGKARVFDNSLKIDFVNEKSTHGLYLILMNCTLDNYIVSGIDRNRLNINALDCVQPLTDTLQPVSVRKCEVYNSFTGINNDDPNGHFGFLPQSYEHICDHHNISGALVLASLGSNALKGWFPRKYFGSSLQSHIVHSQGFMHANTVDLDAANLPFYDNKYSENFIFTCQFFDVQITDFKKPLSESVDFGSEKDNQKVTLDVGGSRLG